MMNISVLCRIPFLINWDRDNYCYSTTKYQSKQTNENVTFSFVILTFLNDELKVGYIYEMPFIKQHSGKRCLYNNNTRSRKVAGSNLRELQCCHVATGSLIHKKWVPDMTMCPSNASRL